MGFFTKSQIEEIRRKIFDRHSVKDSEFERRDSVDANDDVAILHNGENRLASVDELVNGDVTLTVTCDAPSCTIMLQGKKRSSLKVTRGEFVDISVSADGYVSYETTMPVLLTQTLPVVLIPAHSSDFLGVELLNGSLPSSGGDTRVLVSSNTDWNVD